MPLEKSAAYSMMFNTFKKVGEKPLNFTSLELKYVNNFENLVEEIESKINEITVNMTAGADTDQLVMEARALMDTLHSKYVKSAKYKNHIDVWNEWQKLEDKFNDLEITLSYDAPAVTLSVASPPGNKSAAYIKFHDKFITSVNKKPHKYTSLNFKRVKKFEELVNKVESKINEIAANKGKTDTQQLTDDAKALMTAFYEKYVNNSKCRNHIDVWLEFMKLEDKFNEVGITLNYAVPNIKT